MEVATTAPDYMSEQRRQHVTAIVRDAGRRLLRFIRARVRSDAEAEDILQEVWRQLVTTIEDEPIERVGAWLYTVARRRIIDGYRKPRLASLDAAGQGSVDSDGEWSLAEMLPQDDATPEAAHVRQVFWERLHAALAELPEEQRQVFVWHELDELSFREIAELTGENLNTLLARKRYAVLRLREALESFRQEFYSQPSHRFSP